jgi:uncharacterized protein YifN (PemK superfamily)
MKVIFKDSDEQELGRIEHTSFGTILVPAFKEGAHDMFLKYKFLEHEETLVWQVLSVATDVEKSTAEVVLRAAKSVLSVAEFAKSQVKKVDFYIKEFQIVEVDFGFYSNLFLQDGTVKANDLFNAALLPGEMHKRRPCITLKAKGNRIQVIPLSTVTPNEGDKLCIPISQNSFKGLASRYRMKNSYAVLNMIQTVSAYRVHPPRNMNKEFEHKYFLYKLNSSDKAILKQGLEEQYTQWSVAEKKILEKKRDNLSHEKMKLIGALDQLKAKDLENRERVKMLEEFVLSFGSEMGAGSSLEEILAYN